MKIHYVSVVKPDIYISPKEMWLTDEMWLSVKLILHLS